jgi:hypothetical protein
MEYKTIKQWTAEFRQWVTREPDAFYGSVIIAESTFICFWLAPSKDWILIWGLILQVLGIAVAIQNLLRIRITCNQVPLRKRFGDWIEAFPKLKRVPIVANKSFKAPLSQIVSQVDLVYDSIADDSIEGRITRLEGLIDGLRNESWKSQEDIEGLKANLEKMHILEEEARETMRSEIRQEIEHLFTQDIIGSLVGFILVIYGLVLSTLAGPIFNL